MERERRALTLKIVPSSFFFCTSHREREHFFLLWFPLTSKKFSFFLPFFLCLLPFSVLPFLFYRSRVVAPIKKIITRRRIFFRRPLFFVCFFCPHNSNKRGSQNIFAQKRKRPPFFSLDSHKKHEKRSALKKRVKRHVFSLSFFFSNTSESSSSSSSSL